MWKIGHSNRKCKVNYSNDDLPLMLIHVEGVETNEDIRVLSRASIAYSRFIISTWYSKYEYF